MIRFLLKRFIAMAAILLVLSAAVFILRQISPGDPVQLALGGRATKEVVEAKRHELGLDDPLPIQYARYVRALFRGDMGMSLHTKRPVRTDLASRIPATVELMLFAFMVALMVGTLLGVVTAARWRTSGFFRLLLVAGASTPAFLIALAGLIVFFLHLGWLPGPGRTNFQTAPTGPTGLLTVDALLHARLGLFLDALRHLVLPGVSLAIAPAVALGRVLRSSLVTNLRSDYVRTARAKGLREPIIMFRHVLRNSVGPALSLGGVQAAIVFANLTVIEKIFAWPGVGLYMAENISQSDFPAIAGVTLLLGATYVAINALVDILQGVADPRIRVS
jgi:peptide/nickel transport system permease protein